MLQIGRESDKRIPLIRISTLHMSANYCNSSHDYVMLNATRTKMYQLVNLLVIKILISLLTSMLSRKRTTHTIKKTSVR